MELNREQIVKALKLHSVMKPCRGECPYEKRIHCGIDMAKDALALIKELTAENEKLTINMNAYGLAAKRLGEENERLIADTVRKMQSEINKTLSALCKGDVSEIRRMIDQIAKEMLNDES